MKFSWQILFFVFGLTANHYNVAAQVNLTYTYASLTNKLTRVTDNSTAGSANGMLGDFKDGTNGGDDYAYDNNGNLIIDLNKNAVNATGGISTSLGTSGIIYNFLDKPETINITGKGTIKILYDADGNKLQRTFTPASGTVKVTTYINEFVYQGDSLQYINFEEGRIRSLQAVSANNGYDGLAIDGTMDLPNGKRGAYDFFIRDYQQNVRMILTEETHYGINQCTMETTRAANEEPYFGQTGANNEVAQTRADKPPGWTSNTSNKVSNLGALTHKAGPNVLLKVMAGDQINATASYYYQNPVTNGTGNNLTGPIITSLIQSILGSPATGLAKGNTTPISNNLNADANFISKTAPDANNASGNLPKAYLTVVFFNERFEYVSEGSTALRVAQAGNNAAPLVISNIKAPKNGYAYVYLSNESSEPVYFDDFKVADTRGRIIEENHYYAFGLKIAGISSVKMGDANEGSLKNNNLYNDKELFDDADLDWYDYGYRNYDPQIGRFPQLDPLTDDYPELTPYQYASDEPIANVDMDGLEKATAIMDFTYDFASKSSFVFPAATKVVSNAAEKTAIKVGEGIIKQAFKKSFTLFGVASKATNLAALLLTPLKAGVPDEMRGVRAIGEIIQKQEASKKQEGKFEDNEKEHEQYALITTKGGMYPIMQWGYKDPVGQVKLKKGDIWKYGTTVNPESRYTQKWLRQMHLLKVRQDKGSAPYVLAQEGIKIIKYFVEYGKLPPGNKMFK